MLTSFIDIVLIIILNFVAYALGRKIFRIFRFQFASFTEESLFSYGIGLSLLGYGTFLLGMLGLLYAKLFAFIFLFLGILSISEMRRFIKNLKSIFSIKDIKYSIFDIFLISILCGTAFFIFIDALAPPGGSDPSGWWLAIPKIFIRNHKIINIPYIHQSYWPFLLPMLFTAGMLIHTDILAQLIHFSLSIGCILAVYSFSRRWFSRRTSFLACAFFYGIPIVYSIAGGAFVDLGITFYTLLSIYAFFNWLREEKRGDQLFISALFLGVAGAIKITGFIPICFIFPGIIYKLYHLRKKVPFIPAVFKKLMLYTFIVVAISSPWYIRSYIYTGNAIYPFRAERFFNIKGVDSLKGKYVSIYPVDSPEPKKVQDKKKALKILFGFLRMPWDLTMRAHVNYLMMSFGPAFLAFIPLLIFCRKLKGIIIGLFLCTFAYVSFWSLGPVLVTRYLLPIIPLAAILAAYSVTKITETDTIFRRTLLAFVIFPLSFNFLLTLRANTFGAGGMYNKFPVVFGLQTRERYLSRIINYYDAFQYINNRLPPSAKILFLWQSDSYYCERDFLIGNPYRSEANYRFRDIDYSTINSAIDLLKQLKKNGISHVLENEIEERQHRGVPYPRKMEILKILKSFKDKYLKLIYNQNKTTLYEVDYSILGRG